MYCKLLGYQDIDFESKQGERIVGVNLFMSSDDEYVKGVRTDKFFVSKSKIRCDLKIDSYYDVAFGRRGSVDHIDYVGDELL